jgi:hypothetical protein
MRFAKKRALPLAEELLEGLPPELNGGVARALAESIVEGALAEVEHLDLRGAKMRMFFGASLEVSARRRAASGELSSGELYILCRVHEHLVHRFLVELKGEGATYLSALRRAAGEGGVPPPLPPRPRIRAVLASLGLVRRQRDLAMTFLATAVEKGYSPIGKNPRVVAGAVAHIWSPYFGLGHSFNTLEEDLGVSAEAIKEHEWMMRELDLNLFGRKVSFSEEEVRRWKDLYEDLGSFRGVERAEERISRRTGSPAPSVVTIIDRLKATFDSKGGYEAWRDRHTRRYTEADVDEWEEIYERRGSFHAVKRRLVEMGREKVPSVPTIAERLHRRGK